MLPEQGARKPPLRGLANQRITRLVLFAPHAIVNKVPHLARARAGFTGIAALPGELLALLTPSLIRWIIHVASLAFLTTARE